ncbi:MAG: replicative DNA helicase [Candidatus Omnitrophica bacterium]|nr:replicative DNA helicase [Candidatus Omnitrophota bacterium]
MAEKETPKNLPFSFEAERAVLAAMLHDSDAMLAGLEVLREVDNLAKRDKADSQSKKRKGFEGTTLFFHTPYQHIFDLIVHLEEQGVKPNFVSLLEAANKRKLLDQIGGSSAIMEVIEAAATGSEVIHFADIVKEKFLLRRLIYSTNTVLDRAFEDSEDATAILEDAESALHEIADSRHRGAFVRIGDMLEPVQQALLEAFERKGVVTGVQTHFTMLDEMTSGLQRTDLIILAARPSMGKTALALNMVENIASKSKQTVGFFSLEMSTTQVIQRLLSSLSQVDLQRLRSGHLSMREKTRVLNALGNMAPLPIFVDDTPGLSISSVRGRALRLKHQQPDLSLLVVDYLQLMEAGASRGQRSRQEEVSAISRGLKAIARELEVPVLALSQLSRGVEGRESGEPRLSDLRESGAIEQDADVVMFIHRKKVAHDEETEEDLKAEIIIGKQRNGPIGKVPVAFISRYAAFKNLATFEAPEDVLAMPDDEGLEEYGVDDGVPF